MVTTEDESIKHFPIVLMESLLDDFFFFKGSVYACVIIAFCSSLIIGMADPD